jgi:SAM-dependent methyltransferase
MKKALAILSFALLGLTAFAPASSTQELVWDQYRGYDVPFVPTPPEVVDEMLRLVAPKPGDVLYDLGCGDGRIVIAAAQKYGVKALGIDIDPVRIGESNDNAAKAGLTGKVRFIQQNLFEADFKDATVVTMYLLTSVNLRLRPKLLADLRPGTRLVSHSFDMGDWRPDKTVLVETSYGDQRSVHFWVIPANVSGRWEWDLGAGDKKRHFSVQAVQEFQSVSASGTEGTWLVAVNDLSLVGDRIKFQLDTETDGKMASFLYEGAVKGDVIEGTVRPAGDPKAAPVKWKAVRDPKTVVPIAK